MVSTRRSQDLGNAGKEYGKPRPTEDTTASATRKQVTKKLEVSLI